MSLRVVGVVALAGLTAVAAYILLFRKKDEEPVDQPGQETPTRPEKEPQEETTVTPEKSEHHEEHKDDFEHVEISVTSDGLPSEGVTSEGFISAEMVTIEEPKTNNTIEKVDKSYDAAEDITIKNESLIEWIDRQLKEAESKSRNVTPVLDSKIDQSASLEEVVSKTLANTNNSTRRETDISTDVEAPLSEAELKIIKENKEVKQDIEDSVEILEFESVTIPTKAKTEIVESLEIISQNNVESHVEIMSEVQSRETNEDTIESNKNSAAGIDKSDTHPVAKSAVSSEKFLTDWKIESGQRIEEQKVKPDSVTDISSIEFINLSMPDFNSNIPEKNINNDKENEEIKTDIVETDDFDSRKVYVLSDEELREQNKVEDAEIAMSSDTNIITADLKNVSYTDADCSKISQVADDSDAEIQLLKGDSEHRISNILEDTEDSEIESEAENSIESVKTELTLDGAKSDEDNPKVEAKSDKSELNDSIGLILRPSWQMKKPSKNQKGLDEKLTSI